MRKAILALAVLFALPVMAQTAPPVQTTSTAFAIGASAFGLGGSTGATPASDVSLSIAPGFSTKGYLSQLSLMSDSLLAPSPGLQYYGGGLTGPIPVKLSGALSGLSFFWRATAGADRIVPATGPSQAHFGLMAGGGARWQGSSGVKVTIVEVDFLRTPGAPWGANAPAVSGGIGFAFGKQ